MPGTVIVGAGPGIGAAVARRFAREGHTVGLIARTGQVVQADVTDEVGLRAALDELTQRFGIPDVLVYNAALIRADRPGELRSRELLDAWAVNVGGAMTTAAHILPAMAARGSGTFILTGGMPEPKVAYTSLSLGKAGIRTLTALLAQEYGPSGVRVATVTVAGTVATGTAFDPDLIAEQYWRLYRRPPGQMELEVVFG